MTVACQPLNLSVERDRPAPLSAIRLFLESRNYPAWAIDHVTEHVERHGTADVGPSFMLSEDREHVGRLAALYRVEPGVSVPIPGHVNAVRRAHRLLTGQELDWEAAVARLVAFEAVQGGFPARLWEVQAGCHLIAETYSPESIRRVLAHVAIFGRAAGCPDLDAGDAEAVDAILAARGGRR